MSGWTVRATDDFWASVARLRESYDRGEYVAIVRTIREAIEELAEKGRIEESGWGERALRRAPFDDGCHFEFHIHDDDVLVVYFRRERRRVIRMVGAYTHRSTPGSRS